MATSNPKAMSLISLKIIQMRNYAIYNIVNMGLRGQDGDIKVNILPVSVGILLDFLINNFLLR